MKYIKTYEGLFDFFKKKVSFKPNISDNDLHSLIEDCFMDLKDDEFIINVRLKKPSLGGRIPRCRDGIATTTPTLHNHIEWKSLDITIEKKETYYSFSDIKHNVMQLHNMLNDYANIKISFSMEYWDFGKGNTFVDKDKKKTIRYNNILSGLYDNISTNTFTINVEKI
jgi:hypothetical protein